MSIETRRFLFEQLDAISFIDPHTHIDAHNPASQTLADILGYHYYTELAHSAGMDTGLIEEPALEPRRKVARLVEHLGPLENTVQYSWLIEMARELFDFQAETLTPMNWEALFETAERRMAQGDWADQVLKASRLRAVFLTNDFDDPLEGFDTQTYIPCLRTDDLVFHLCRSDVYQRLAASTGIEAIDADSLRTAIGKLFDHFTSRGARACAISLPSDFAPVEVSDTRAATALSAVLRKGAKARREDQQALANFVFWTIAGRCADYRLPLDLMIGVTRGVYPQGVYQGMDLYDSRYSLIQYRDLFNAFPRVTFPVSVLTSGANQDLVDYAWIFPNVVVSGHWWYSNTPTLIEHDLGSRLEAVPQNKLIGYYSDMYKLEFALPKFRMYKRCLAKVLAERFVEDRGWSEERALQLGVRLLQENVERIFPALA